MDTDLLIANRLNERPSVERSLHDINTGVQNQRLVAYPVMIYPRKDETCLQLKMKKNYIKTWKISQ